MQEVHYFQRYSQAENVATNNTLLLLSRLYHFSPYKFSSFLAELFERTGIQAGIRFGQQERAVDSVPDATISQDSFKLAIETKLHSSFSVQQLESHCRTFKDEKIKILISLSPSLNRHKDQTRTAVQKFCTQTNQKIEYVDLKFSEIIDAVRRVLDPNDYEFIQILEDFQDYCLSSNLIDQSNDWMRVVTCGKSSEDNFKFNLYYDPAERGYSPHGYLGIYFDKAVRAIGRITNVVTTDREGDELKIHSSTRPVTEDQKKRILGSMGAAEKRDWRIYQGHKFFIVEKLEKTEFSKETKYPLQSTKFFNLRELLGVKHGKQLPDDRIIAEKLRKLTW